jgi:enolase-phosphatase E1
MNIKYILTDIEGTTTSVSFVYDTLFPYFRENIQAIKLHLDNPEVIHALEETTNLAIELDNKKITTLDEQLETLYQWSVEDRKITPLKTLQGIIWKAGYENGSIKGHVYSDVKASLEKWKTSGIQLGVFSSGSIAAQKLIFGYSEAGDLTPNFSHYFDTTTGGKREVETYTKISKNLDINPSEILFLSDIREELEAADMAGFQTIQLVREGNQTNWAKTVSDFSEIFL